MRKFSLSLLFAFMLMGMFAAVSFAEGPDPANNNDTSDHNVEMTPGEKGTSLENANDTGNSVDAEGENFDSVIKNLTGHTTHTSYQNNTNSCASCHQVHTAKGDQLLFADGVYQTCTACHDGTLGFYNVFADGANATTTGAGTFGGSHGASMHLANDAVKINAAPGGNGGGVTVTGGYQWGENFNCASCHAPHGSFSDRLLQYNPNGIGALPVANGGNALVDVPVLDALPATAGTTDPVEILVRTEDAVADAAGHKKVTVKQYTKKGTLYEETKIPWLYGYGTRTNHNSYWSRLQKADNNAAASGYTSGVYFDYEHSQVYSTATAGADALKLATKGYISRPIIVKMATTGNAFDGTQVTVQSAYWSGFTAAADNKVGNHTLTELAGLGYNVSGQKVTGLGVAMSKFCAACHTDYLSHSVDVSKGETPKSHWGDETVAYRHSTDSDSYTCVRCHYGHGTDALIMKDALGKTVADLTATGGKFVGDQVSALEYMTDNNASSALKKYTNMSVCWACHNSSHAETIKNTDRLADHPSGMPTGQ
jgi:predicted CXXCH cytochrome family protein